MVSCIEPSHGWHFWYKIHMKVLHMTHVVEDINHMMINLLFGWYYWKDKCKNSTIFYHLSWKTIFTNCLERIRLRKRCQYLELLWSACSNIGTEYRETRSISPYTVQTRENTDQNNSEYEHFLCSVGFWKLRVSKI